MTGQPPRFDQAMDMNQADQSLHRYLKFSDMSPHSVMFIHVQLLGVSLHGLSLHLHVIGLHTQSCTHMLAVAAHYLYNHLLHMHAIIVYH